MENNLIISAKALLENDPPVDQYVLEPIVSRGEISMLVGGSDTGKSTWLLCLARAIVKGEEKYCGFTIPKDVENVLVVSTEDGEKSVARKFHEFYQEDMKSKGLENLHFIFDYDDDLFSVLEKQMTKQSYDALIIDSFSDVYSGKDGNSQAEVRVFMKKFDMLAKKYNLALMFLHHINKQGNASRVQKRNVLGSSGLEQKARLILALNSLDGIEGKRDLEIIKGNNVSSDQKRKVHRLKFDEEKLNFELMEVYERQSPTNKSDDSNWKFEAVQYAICELKVGKKDGNTYKQAAEKVSEKFGKHVAHGTLNNWVQKFGSKIKCPSMEPFTVKSKD